MKKIIIFIFIISMLILTTACGTSEEIDTISGTWKCQLGDDSLIYEFTEDTWVFDAFNLVSRGTYTVDGNKIYFITDSGNPLTQSISRSGNTLTINGQKYVRQ